MNFVGTHIQTTAVSTVMRQGSRRLVQEKPTLWPTSPLQPEIPCLPVGKTHAVYLLSPLGLQTEGETPQPGCCLSHHTPHLSSLGPGCCIPFHEGASCSMMFYVFLSRTTSASVLPILPSRFCFLNLPCPLLGRVSLFLLCAHVASYSLVFPHFAESSTGLHISQAGPLISFPGVSQHFKTQIQCL